MFSYFTFPSPFYFNKESTKIIVYESLTQQYSDEHTNH